MRDESPRAVRLREVEDGDLEVFFRQQCEPEAVAMAAVAPRGRDRFFAHWLEVIVADPQVRARTITYRNHIAGYVLSFPRDGRRLVGYWIAKDDWGRGIASAALASFLAGEPQRPLHAYVATSNPGSLRVLEKCGFYGIATQTEFGEALGYDVEELLLRLD